MHAIDRFRRPRPESVLTSAELAAITTPTIFILGSDDPYLSIERARTSIDQIQGGRLYEVPGGHAPWLAGAHHAAGLIATHSHLAPDPHLTPTPGEKPAERRARPDRQQQERSRSTRRVGVQVFDCHAAASSYSWISPPSRSRRRMR